MASSTSTRPRQWCWPRSPERTSRLRLGTAVTLLANLDALRVAEDYATLDILSGGRVNIVGGRGNFFASTYASVRPSPRRVEGAVRRERRAARRALEGQAGALVGTVPHTRSTARPCSPGAPCRRRKTRCGWRRQLPGMVNLAARLGWKLMLPSASASRRSSSPSSTGLWTVASTATCTRRRWAPLARVRHAGQPGRRDRWEPRCPRLPRVDAAAAARREPGHPGAQRAPVRLRLARDRGSGDRRQPRPRSPSGSRPCRPQLHLTTHLLYMDMGGVQAGELFDAIDLVGEHVIAGPRGRSPCSRLAKRRLV